MPNLLTWYVGNQSPSITENIEVEGVPFDLSSSTVRFKMRLVGSSVLKVDQPATIVGSPVDGNVRYDWQAADVDTESPALIWWEVTTGGKKQDVKEYLIEFRAHQPLYDGYVELEEMKKTLTLDGTSFADLDLQGAILASKEGIEDFCGRRFYTTPADEIRYFSPETFGHERRYIDGDPVGYYGTSYLDVGDLNAVTEVAVDLGDDGVFEDIWTLGTHYRLEPFNAALDGKPWDRISLTSNGGKYFPGYAHSVRITGKWGWTPTPASVKLAASMMVSRWVKRMREAPFGVAGIGPDGEPVRIAVTDPDVIGLLTPYRIRNLVT